MPGIARGERYLRDSGLKDKSRYSPSPICQSPMAFTDHLFKSRDHFSALPQSCLLLMVFLRLCNIFVLHQMLRKDFSQVSATAGTSPSANLRL